MLVLKCIHCLWVILEIAIRGIKLDRQSSRGIDKERPNVTRFIALKRVRRTAGSFFLCVCLLVCFVLYVLVFFWWWWWWWCFLLLMVCFVIFFFFQKISGETLILWEGPSVFVCVFCQRLCIHFFLWKGSMHLWIHGVLWLWIYVCVVDNPKGFCMVLQKRGISTLTLPAVLYWSPKPFLEG